ncbi:MAG: hypothetical protein F6K35_23815 [Okeania sp. SIO2H7]|nr:hypothetical protein [Okeania sp. SIO2H7]
MLPFQNRYFWRGLKHHPINCTLLAGWQPEYKDPWFIITDLEPQSADILWYKLSLEIECSFKNIKSDRWQWQ